MNRRGLSWYLIFGISRIRVKSTSTSVSVSKANATLRRIVGVIESVSAVEASVSAEAMGWE